ncbi:hypothetical protein ACJ73_05334 [Blastomyces percursus]|uniref:Uncharacterized protein n=1 Tax=Blastomyces percursus TaxID=1658174 RepID=A0A1J9Q3R9_9EURO|nr:hypothetical protein ACJ73_05334 [Blastomyces percursus]
MIEATDGAVVNRASTFPRSLQGKDKILRRAQWPSLQHIIPTIKYKTFGLLLVVSPPTLLLLLKIWLPLEGVNFVRYFFYAGNTISSSRKKTLVALAYATARDQKLAPKAILIRSDMHDTTTVEGKHVKDPKGWHGTFALKADDQVELEFHVASIGTRMTKRTSF